MNSEEENLKNIVSCSLKFWQVLLNGFRFLEFYTSSSNLICGTKLTWVCWSLVLYILDTNTQSNFINYFSHCCDGMPDKGYLGSGNSLCLIGLQNTAHHVREDRKLELEVTGHIASLFSKQREWNAGAQLSFLIFSVSQAFSPWVDIPYIQSWSSLLS